MSKLRIVYPVDLCRECPYHRQTPKHDRCAAAEGEKLDVDPDEGRASWCPLNKQEYLIMAGDYVPEVLP